MLSLKYIFFKLKNMYLIEIKKKIANTYYL